ncbi:hypothetical protein ACFJIX_29940 [Roseateles sp. UC29_93]|uniref:hypothetical protein n=1 Tax=Roseateles sp. UC29_93 TaxID=3350177 RepID=UPI003672C7D2
MRVIELVQKNRNIKLVGNEEAAHRQGADRSEGPRAGRARGAAAARRAGGAGLIAGLLCKGETAAPAAVFNGNPEK